jgi:uncharacterized membrane protein
MSGNAYGFVVLAVIAICIALLVYLAVRRSLCSLLDKIVKLPAVTTFYLRTFLIGLVFIALSSALKTSFNLKADAALIEYVWQIADGLSSAFGITCLFLVGYLTLLTIIIVVLKNRK